jgi:hypothetical protein
MSTSLMRRAANQIERTTQTAKKLRERIKEQDTMDYIVHGAGAVTGTLIGAAVDAKWADSPTEVANVKGVPINAIVGVPVAVGLAFAPRFMGRGYLGFTALNMALTSLYMPVREKIAEALADDAG